MADWSLFPKDLLLLISEKLDSEISTLRFRSVCSTWRFSIPKPHNHFPFNLLRFPDSNDSVILEKHTIFLVKPPTTPNQQTPYRPWLVRISPTSTGKVYIYPRFLLDTIIPFNLLDFNQLSIFDLGHIYTQATLYPNSSTIQYNPYDHTVITFQGEQILDIVTHDIKSGELVMLRHGDDSWTKIPNVASYNQDMCIFKGRPCVTDRTGRTFMIGSDFTAHLVAHPLLGADDSGFFYIIVENESELLLVREYEGDCDGDNHYDDDDDDDEHVRFDVFRLDQEEKKWFKLANLGDRVLFLLQGYSFTVSAVDLGFDNGNFLIYWKDVSLGDCELIVFHLDLQRNLPLSDYPEYFKLFWPPPEWIVSRCL